MTNFANMPYEELEKLKNLCQDDLNRINLELSRRQTARCQKDWLQVVTAINNYIKEWGDINIVDECGDKFAVITDLIVPEQDIRGNLHADYID